MEIVFFLILGLIVGSFLNVVIFRLKDKESPFKGRSRCPKCKRNLFWYELIPVLSFLIQGGRCRKCRQKISWQYPLVEMATGFLFVLVFLVVSAKSLTPVSFWIEHQNAFYYLQIIRGLIFVSFLVVIFVYDFKYYLILDKVTVPAMIAAVLLNGLLQPDLKYILYLFFAGLVAGGFFWLQFVISKGRWIGGGDIRLGFLMGLMVGWPQVLTALMIAYFLGAVFGLILLSLRRKKMNSEIPFGTFLSLGVLLAFFWADVIQVWYFNMLYF